MPKAFAKPFLISLVLITFVACYFIFKPFLIEIVVAAIFVTIFYHPYEKLVQFFRGRKNIAAFLMCLLLTAIIILPVAEGLVYAAKKSTVAYGEAVQYFSNHDAADLLQTPLAQKLHADQIDIYSLSHSAFGNVLLGFFEKSSNWLVNSATTTLLETTSFILSLLIIIITMFFFFVDGERLLKRVMYLSPLPDQYDREIFKKFKEVSYTTMASTFVVAVIQAIFGGLGFAIIGFPVFLGAISVAVLSLMPYFGSLIFYIPVGLYYLLMGQIWQGIFIIAWGFLFVGSLDNLVRAWMLKGKARLNPIFVIFSVLGGVMLFGFWGLVLGPLIVAITATVLHIYALEYCQGHESEADPLAPEGNEV